VRSKNTKRLIWWICEPTKNVAWWKEFGSIFMGKEASSVM
jgi:hypothetical protein